MRSSRIRLVTLVMLCVVLCCVEIQALEPYDATPIEPAEQRIGIMPIPPLPVEIKLWANKPNRATYHIGERITFYFRANRDCHVFIYDFDTRGNVNVLFPNQWDMDNHVRAGVTYRIPSSRVRYGLAVEGPPGWELVHAVAIVHPGYHWRFEALLNPPLWHDDWRRAPLNLKRDYSSNEPSSPKPKQSLNKQDLYQQAKSEAERNLGIIKRHLHPYPTYSWGIATYELFVSDSWLYRD